MTNMNQDSDSDYEQVFIINDTDDCSGDQHKPFKGGNDGKQSNDYYKTKQSDISVAKSTFSGFAIFLAVLFAVVLIAIIIGSVLNLDVTKLAVFMFFFPLLIILIMLGNRDDSAYIAEKNAMANQTSNVSPRKSKKFNTIQEHRAYERSASGGNGNQNPVNSESQRLEKQKAENIELAVRALVSLKFKINRANDLVSRALDSGIPHEDTQMLIKYALTNNNKA